MIVPLNKIGFSWEGHKSALWWLGLLYRRPKEFRESLEEICLRENIVVLFKILLQFLPYLILFVVLGRVLIYDIIGLEAKITLTSLIDILFFHSKQIAFGIASGIAVGIVYGIP